MCTNPFKSGEMIDDIIFMLDRNEKADAVITVERLLDHHPARIKKIENGYIRDFCVEEELESRRQDLKPEAYIRNGNIYALRRDLLMTQKARYGTNFCVPYYKEDIPSANIDEPSDFYKAESLLNDWIQKMKRNILLITPIKHIPKVYDLLEKSFNIYYFPDFKYKDLVKLKNVNFYAIYTNPNKSRVRIDKKIINALCDLKYVVTASTGTNHIEKKLLKQKNIKLISLTRDLKTIKTISSTAEHAFALTLNAIRNIDAASRSVRNGEWDYLPFVGRQMNKLNILIVGFGRLGKMYYKYAKSFGSTIKVCDPYVQIKKNNSNICFVDLIEGVKDADIISLHVHHTKETEKMINKKNFEALQGQCNNYKYFKRRNCK